MGSKRKAEEAETANASKRTHTQRKLKNAQRKLSGAQAVARPQFAGGRSVLDQRKQIVEPYTDNGSPQGPGSR